MHITLHAIGNINWGDFHPYFIHLPIILFTLGLLCDLLYGIGKKGALTVGHWMIIIGTLFVIPAVLTGFAAVEEYVSEDPILARHKLLGLLTIAYAIPYAIFRLYLYKSNWYIHPIIVVGLSVILVGLLLQTNEYGGQLILQS